MSATKSSRRAPEWAGGAVIAAIAVVTCLAYLAGGRAAIGTSDRDRVFSPADEPRWQLAVPALDVPIGRPPTASTLAARLSLAVARGRRTALRDLAAVTSAAAIALFGVWLRGTTVGIFPTALAMIGMAAGATFWWRGVSWNADALAPALALGALCGLWRWWSTRSRVMLAIAIGAGVAAAADALASYQGLVSALESRSPLDLVNQLSDEFTTLGLLLAVIGVSVLVQSKATRVPAIIAAASLLMWSAAAPRAPIEIVSLPLAIAGWAAIAVALNWMVAVLPPRNGLALATVVAVMLIAEPVLTRARLWALGRGVTAELARQAAFDLNPATVPEGAVFVAESRRVDAAILLSSRQTARAITIVPQSPAPVLAAAREGRTVFVFPGARANLEHLGFVFDNAWLGNTAVGVMGGQLPCVALAGDQWRDVSLLVARGSFIVHGVAPGVAPGGVTIRITNREPIRVTSIEPRSIPFDVAETAPADADRVTTIHVSPTGRTEPVVIMLDAPPFGALASSEGAASSLCAGVLRGAPTLGRADAASATLRMSEYAPFGPGWHPIEADPDIFRWTGAPDASVRVTMSRPGPVRITVTARPAARPDRHPTIGLTVNGCRLETQPMAAEQQDFGWLAGESCWQAGVNQLWLHVTPLVSPASMFATHDTRLLGARIGAIRLQRQ